MSHVRRDGGVPRKSDRAWLAGLFEGEGSITLKNRHAELAITSTDRDVLERVVALTGFGKIYQQKRIRNYKVCYRFHLGKSAEVWMFVKWISPWLCERRSFKVDIIRRQVFAGVECVVCGDRFKRNLESRQITCSEECDRERRRIYARTYYRTVLSPR